MKTKFNNSEVSFHVTTDVSEYIASRLENCFCEAEIYGFDSACWQFLREMADLADFDIDAMSEAHDF